MGRVNHTTLDGKIAGNLRTLIDEEALAQARGQLIAQGWLTADEISLLTDFTPEQFANWKCEHCIFSVHKKGAGEIFPCYELDENLRPLPVMKSILDILTKVKTPWGIAEWFATSNDLLFTWVGSSQGHLNYTDTTVITSFIFGRDDIRNRYTCSRGPTLLCQGK